MVQRASQRRRARRPQNPARGANDRDRRGVRFDDHRSRLPARPVERKRDRRVVPLRGNPVRPAAGRPVRRVRQAGSIAIVPAVRQPVAARPPGPRGRRPCGLCKVARSGRCPGRGRPVSRENPRQHARRRRSRRSGHECHRLEPPRGTTHRDRRREHPRCVLAAGNRRDARPARAPRNPAPLPLAAGGRLRPARRRPLQLGPQRSKMRHRRCPDDTRSRRRLPAARRGHDHARCFVRVLPGTTLRKPAQQGHARPADQGCQPGRIRPGARGTDPEIP